MNPLKDNPRARKIVYTVLWVVGLALGAANVWRLLAGNPPWLLWTDEALGVYAFVSSYVGYQASEHVDTSPHAQPEYEASDFDPTSDAPR